MLVRIGPPWPAPPKQRHTAAKVCRRLKEEHDYRGSYDRVRLYVRGKQQRQRETFIPLDHDPGQRVEADFGHIYVDFPERAVVMSHTSAGIHVEPIFERARLAQLAAERATRATVGAAAALATLAAADLDGLSHDVHSVQVRHEIPRWLPTPHFPDHQLFTKALQRSGSVSTVPLAAAKAPFPPTESLRCRLFAILVVQGRRL